MPQFQTRPVPVEARQHRHMRSVHEILDWVNQEDVHGVPPSASAWIEKGEKPGSGDLFLDNRTVCRIDPGDWIVKTPDGSFSRCKSADFATLYQKIP